MICGVRGFGASIYHKRRPVGSADHSVLIRNQPRSADGRPLRAAVEHVKRGFHAFPERVKWPGLAFLNRDSFPLPSSRRIAL